MVTCLIIKFFLGKRQMIEKRGEEVGTVEMDLLSSPSPSPSRMAVLMGGRDT